MTTQELVERLLTEASDADETARQWNAASQLGPHLRAAASRLSEMDAEIKRLRDAMRLIANRPTNIPMDPHGMAQFARAALEHDKGEPKP